MVQSKRWFELVRSSTGISALEKSLATPVSLLAKHNRMLVVDKVLTDLLPRRPTRRRDDQR